MSADILASKTILVGMRVVIETPRWSFTKYRFDGGAFRPEFVSPLPSAFNYGFIEGTKAADGMPKDAIVLGPRLPCGTKVEAEELGTVYFVDDGIEDDKAIASSSGGVNAVDKAMIHVFFLSYMAFKTVYYLLRERRLALCSYGGFSLSHR